MIQRWWYGHNAVGFFLTAGFLGMMYYFVPKQCGRPVYCLSFVDFALLVFDLYLYLGRPHHFNYTSLPDWAQTLGMTFSIILWMPSWGVEWLTGWWPYPVLGINWGLTLFLLHDYLCGVLRDVDFWRPMMSIKAVELCPTILTGRLVTCIPEHWDGSDSSVLVLLYYLVPRLWGRDRLYSLKPLTFICGSRRSVSFFIFVRCGYLVSCKAWCGNYDSMGFHDYSFVETVSEMHIYYVIRAMGGVLYLSGALIMVYNFIKTIKGMSDVLNIREMTSIQKGAEALA